MASFNRVIVAGNLTRPPELRHLQSGMAVTDLGLAINDRRKSETGEWIEETTFVDVTLWGRTAEVACEYLNKGSPVLIEGRLKLDTWETREGEKRSKLKVVGERMQMLGGKGEGGGGGASRGAPAGAARGGRRSAPPPQDDDYGDAGGDYDRPPSGGSGRGAPAEDDIPF